MVAAKNKVELRECVAACVWRWMSECECESLWTQGQTVGLEFACEKCFCFDSHLEFRLTERNVFKNKAIQGLLYDYLVRRAGGYLAAALNTKH